MSNISKNTMLYTIASILPQAASFLLIPIYTRFLSTSDYGILSSMEVINYICSICFVLALNKSVSRLYFDYKEESDIKRYLGTIMILIFLTSTFFLILFLVLNNYLVLIFTSIPFFPYFLLAILATYFSVFSYVPMIYLRVTENVKKYITISLSQFFFRMMIKLFLVVILLQGVYGALLAGLITNFLFFIFFIFMSYKIATFSFDKNIAKESLLYSIPLIPASLTAFLISASDRILIERYINLDDLGIYSVGYKIASIMLVLSMGYERAFAPIFYRIANSDYSINQRKKELSYYMNYYIRIIILFAFSISLFSKELISIITEESFHESYRITMLIALSNVFILATSSYNLMIHQEKKTTYIMKISIFITILNIFLNFLLIPEYGIYGAAFATIFSLLFSLILHALISKKCFYIPLRIKMLTSSLFFLIIITFACDYLLIDYSLFLSLLTKIGIYLIIIFMLYRDIFLSIIVSLKLRSFVIVN